ncbi:MAG: LAGLIDADG family homing endonuclease [Candidatus Diapherotrites archaeon]|nr:LAGLIDADG family homing endonuclease [Candidatus Diapherotrites archaeon]
MRVTFHSKRLFEMLTQRFQLPAGVKSYTVLIPKEILDSTPQNIAAVLRGMFDTDGCVFFDNRKAYKVPYMRIVLTMKNPPILAQVVEVLARLGIHGHISRGRDVHIIAREDIDQFLRVVGFSNPKHIDKVLKAYPDFEEYNPGTRRNQLLAVE